MKKATLSACNSIRSGNPSKYRSEFVIASSNLQASVVRETYVADITTFATTNLRKSLLTHARVDMKL